MKNLMKLLGLTILMVVIVGCETPTSYHEHIYDETNWTSDGTHHWHKAICGCNEVSDKATHTWDSGEITTQPTFTSEGVKTFTCTVCSTTKTETIEKSVCDHTIATVWTSNDTHHWHSASCGNDNHKTDYETHSYTSYNSDDNATCTTDGTETGTCKCGKTDTRTEVDSKLGHDFSNNAQTCRRNGCNEVNSNYVAPHTHNYSSEWSKDDTHHWKKCTCGEKSEKAEHTWNDGEVTTQPTCTESGVKTYTCTVCGKTRTETVSAKGHDFDETKTCTDHTVTCRRNGCSGTKLISGKGHTEDNGTVTTEPTCTESGVRTYKCTVCGTVTRTETVNANGHTFGENDTTTEKCGTCGCDNPNYVAPLPSVSVKKQSNKMIVYIGSDTTGVICCEDDERFNKYFKATTKSTNVTYYVTLIDNLVVVVESSKVDDNNFYTETYKFTTDQTTLTSNDILASSSYIKIYGVKIPPQNN